MFTPLISVIIPSYNRKNIVIEAIKSALEQQPKNFEVIVIDDGSIDGTEDYLKFLNLPITILKKENGGVSSARNIGIKIARGEYVAFLDSDDVWLPGILDNQLSYLQSHLEIPLVYTDQYIEVDGINLEKTRFNREVVSEEYKTRFNLSGFVQHMPIHISSVMVRKNIFEEIGYFNEDLKIHEDTEMWNRISEKYNFGYIEKPLAIFRWEKDKNHLLKEGFRKKFVDEGKKYMKIYEKIKQGHLTDEEKQSIKESYAIIEKIEHSLTFAHGE